MPTQNDATLSWTVAVGVVRQDAILIPIAGLQAGRWHPLVKEFDENGTFSIGLTVGDTSLIGREWLSFSLTGGSGTPLAVRESSRAEALCTRIDGFRTDAPVQSVAPNRQQDGITFVALLGAGNVARPESLAAPFDPHSQKAVVAIETLMPSLELSMIEADTASAIRGYAPAERAAVGIQITRLVRHRRDEAARYYFEAVKRYPSQKIVFAHGWLVELHGQLLSVSANAELTDDDRKGVTSAAVLGVIELPGRTIWVLHEGSYESRALSLMEFGAGTTGRIVARIPNGAC